MPKDKVLVPGVITHASNIVEHPELIAERIMRFAKLVGRENVIAGADCGFSSQALYSTEVHPTVVWEKFKAMREGAEIATRQLWAKAGEIAEENKPVSEENEPAGEEGEEEAGQSAFRRAREEAMKRLLVGLAAASIIAAPASAADPVKIGFVDTFSGPAAIIGNDMRNGFDLGITESRPADGRGVRSKSSMKTTRQSRKSASRKPTN